MTHTETRTLLARLNRLGHTPTWTEASLLGVELVHQPDPADTGTLHTANGDILVPREHGWKIVDGAAAGTKVRSGDMERVHQPGISPTARIHPTAQVDPTARVEADAVIGQRVVIGAHAHIGRGSTLSRSAYISAGTLIGAATTIRQAVTIGQGAVVGAGSDIGPHSIVGSGARLPQQTTLDAHTNIGAGEDATIVPPMRPRHVDPRRIQQIAATVERLATMNRGIE